MIVPVAPQCVPAQLNRSAVLPGTIVSASPLPDSLDASPRTQISLLGVPAAQLKHVSVSGSRSGAHAGRLLAYSQGDGASFVPSQPFSSRETVLVRGTISVPGKPVQAFAFHFTVAQQDQVQRPPASSDAVGKSGDVQRFHSRTDLRPPVVTVTTDSPQAAPGDVFATPYSGPGQHGPMIFDDAGNLVWFDPLPRGTEATDLQVQQYFGKPVLTWWQGYIPPQGFGQGVIEIADSSYRTLGEIRAGNGYQADLHDFDITPTGTGLMTVFDPIACNLSAVGGPHAGALSDSVLQEIDLKTGLVRREWHAVDHVGLSESYSVATHTTTAWPYDYFHLNSVDQQPDGSLLISARNTWGLYTLDGLSGQVTSRIGGKLSSVKMGAGSAGAYQHDAHAHPDGTISEFDNGGVPKIHAESRGTIVKLDPTGGATLVTQFTHTPALLAGSQGNFQELPGGDAFVGWGSQPYFSEYSPSGQVLFDAHMPAQSQSYRGYRFPWAATPASPPSIAFAPATKTQPATVYASWNGATNVASWRVFAGSSPRHLEPVASAARGGFETAIQAPGAAAYYAVQALDASGAVLRDSPAIKR